MWTLHKQPQHCGAQMHARDRTRQRQEVPADATAGREAQEHDKADIDSGGRLLQPGDYPASSIENRHGDNTPGAPGDKPVEWDQVVQPQQRQGK